MISELMFINIHAHVNPGERWRSEPNPHDWVLEEAEVLVQIVTMRSQHGFDIMVM